MFFNTTFIIPYQRARVWNHFKPLAKMDSVSNTISSVMNFFKSFPFSKSIWSIIQRLVTSAVIFNIWQERNSRLFNNFSRSTDEVSLIIKQTVRLRLSGLIIKQSKKVQEAMDVWGFSLLNV